LVFASSALFWDSDGFVSDWDDSASDFLRKEGTGLHYLVPGVEPQRVLERVLDPLPSTAAATSPQASKVQHSSGSCVGGVQFRAPTWLFTSLKTAVSAGSQYLRDPACHGTRRLGR